MIPPPNWELMWENICKSRKKFQAPVDSMGCDQAHDKADKDINQRFQVLVSLMLSSQTKDPITWAAVQKLKEAGIGNVDGILSAKEKDIEDLIYPVGFYRRKAIYLKKVAEILKRDYAGDIPNTLEALCALPGVGPKMAHLCMMEAWNIISGIGVDTHVHRISARLNWVPKGLKNPEDTRKALESWLPHDQWRLINHLLVGFGQTICTPVNPKCDQCFNNSICPSSSSLSVVAPKKSAAKKIKVKVEKKASKVVTTTTTMSTTTADDGEIDIVVSRNKQKKVKLEPKTEEEEPANKIESKKKEKIIKTEVVKVQVKLEPNLECDQNDLNEQHFKSRLRRNKYK